MTIDTPPRDRPATAPVVRIGLLRLTDAAPIVVAQEKGLFDAHDLDARLSIEPSWANIADKLTYGLLDAAVMPPPLALAISLGLRGVGADLIVPMSLSLDGNSITVSSRLAAALAPVLEDGPMAIGERLRAYARARAGRLEFAVVHVYSTHNLLLRYWLASCGIDPDQDVDLRVVPPAEAADALAAGRIDGFCAGAPWGQVATDAGSGRTIVRTSEIWGRHPEKCLALTAGWADANPGATGDLLDALLAAAAYCDRPANAPDIAELLGGRRYIDIDPAIIRASLPREDHAPESAPPAVDRSIFFANAANFPWPSHAGWFLDQMARWGQLPQDADRAAAVAIYRPDLFRAAALRAGLSVPAEDDKSEGEHAGPWLLKGTPSDIPMRPDLFCDGRVFESRTDAA
jgi:NitT/TauT family transport system ATP-binding protein/nitrate/nitrite transport system substrate-binding protein